MKKKIRWGILGPGHIAHSFAKDLLLVPDGELVAVGSRNLDRAKKFGDTYGASRFFGSYEELYNCEEIDVIYIATPHTYHAEHSIAAMDHGNPVLCEKPMGVNRAEVKNMIAASKRNNVFMMEALWSRFNPAIRKIKQMVVEGVIGEIGHMSSDFAFYALDRDEKGRLLNPELAGGSLLDIGIYPIFLTYLMMGKPENILATSRFHHTGVEIQTSMIFDYPKAQALLYSGLTSKSGMRVEIGGSKGTLFIDPRWHETQGFTWERNGETEAFHIPKIGKGYAHEIEEVQDCLRQGKKQSELWTHQNSMDLVGLMDEVRTRTGIVFPFEV
ncbi:Gfo/Idh/MocA family oxidoreductase [Flavobacteriaceae bacterium F89]|uniref:Gfo/Idh/MocA family oxidoreductase n=1 Tax=Cerina litoralis TaxID=2874477 RepID=A0AAE3EW64_9FLAO|nr:Gfo/Idh/MocA family oxidoreductase [Cerina litoralis]MCG2461274.1 Gfo/Idh/MocA family oxidoreductase [Cerina litoralis]